MKILFLDVDGVLNSHRTLLAFGRFGFPGDLDGYKFDSIAIKMINATCADQNVGVVVSSTWRMGSSVQELQGMFGNEGLQIPVIGKTPVLDKMRGHEIDQWLSEHQTQVDEYVILDDDSDMLPSQKEHFVKVNRATGLSFHNMIDLARILKIHNKLLEAFQRDKTR